MTVEIFAEEGLFRSQEPISQPRGIFAAHFTAAKWGCGAAKWHSCAKGVFRNYEMVLQRVLGLGNEALEDFAAVSQLQNGGLGCEMALMCQRGVSQLQKFSHGVGLGLRNDFVEEGLFCSETSISKRVVLGCEIIS